MSTGNIIDQEYDPETGELTVTFSVHGGGTRTYTYSGAAAIAIQSGDDPSRYPTEQSDGTSGLARSIGRAASTVGEVEETAGEAAEIIGGLL